MKREELIGSISSCVNDYKINKITSDHVDKWVKQFKVKEQIVILKELDHILKNYYVSRKQAKNMLKSFLLHDEVTGVNPYKYLKKVNFLNIQKKGNSQKDMLELVSEILIEEFGLEIENCGGSNDYIYIDDCIFTGNRFRYDIVPWINKKKFRQKSRLITYHLAHHTSGYQYAYKHIIKEAKNKGVDISIWKHLDIDNNKSFGKSIEVLWPYKFSGSTYIDKYYRLVRQKCKKNDWEDNCFRTYKIRYEKLFTSSETRDTVERAFLEVGSRLVDGAANPSESMRPLGFEKLTSLGLGSVFITYRNISNNCPLALWYGDIKKTKGPLGNWYPLFKRKANNNRIDLEVKYL